MTLERLEWCQSQVKRQNAMPDADLELVLASYDMHELFRLARVGMDLERAKRVSFPGFIGPAPKEGG